jgi:hypothetical protein
VPRRERRLQRDEGLKPNQQRHAAGGITHLRHVVIGGDQRSSGQLWAQRKDRLVPAHRKGPITTAIAAPCYGGSLRCENRP